MQQDMALALGSKSRVVGLLGATRSIAAKESLIATLIGSKECQLEHAKLGHSPDIDSGVVIFRKPATQTVYMYVDNGWMLNTRFLGRVQEILKKASTCTAGDGTGHCAVLCTACSILLAVANYCVTCRYGTIDAALAVDSQMAS